MPKRRTGEAHSIDNTRTRAFRMPASGERRAGGGEWREKAQRGGSGGRVLLSASRGTRRNVNQTAPAISTAAMRYGSQVRFISPRYRNVPSTSPRLR